MVDGSGDVKASPHRYYLGWGIHGEENKVKNSFDSKNFIEHEMRMKVVDRATCL